MVQNIAPQDKQAQTKKIKKMFKKVATRNGKNILVKKHNGIYNIINKLCNRLLLIKYVCT